MERNKPEQSIGENLVVNNDWSVKVKCSKCGTWEEYGNKTKQSDLLVQRAETAKAWICSVCYRKPQSDAVLEREMGAVQGYHLGQALNLAQAELLAQGKTSEMKGYWDALLALRNEYLHKAVLK